MATATRERLLEISLHQFAEHGFDGVSIAGIASELGFSKQALLHHFDSKEKLYGEVLARISREFQARLDDPREDGGVDDVARQFGALAADNRRHPVQARLLMRELLDNSERSARAGHWYLREFLETLVDRVHALPRWRDAGREEAAAAVYQFLGAINYFAVSAPTLKAIFGNRLYSAMDDCYDRELLRMVQLRLEAGPA
jgi:AcrR family transcriptional regulator